MLFVCTVVALAVGLPIDVPGLGQPVFKVIATQYFTMGMFNGLAFVGIAIILAGFEQACGRCRRVKGVHQIQKIILGEWRPNWRTP